MLKKYTGEKEATSGSDLTRRVIFAPGRTPP